MQLTIFSLRASGKLYSKAFPWKTIAFVSTQVELQAGDKDWVASMCPKQHKLDVELGVDMQESQVQKKQVAYTVQGDMTSSKLQKFTQLSDNV